MVARGDRLRYHSYAGDVYDAVVRSTHQDAGFVNIDVRCSFACEHDILSLNRVTLYDGPTKTRGCVWPAGATE
jgi:hypothetical protein